MTYWQPVFPFLMFVTLAGVILWRTRPRWLIACAILLFLFSWPPSAKIPLRWLEGRFSVQPPSPSGIQAIVVLASDVLPANALRPAPMPAWDTYQRCHYAAWLYQNGFQLPVLASGRGSAGRKYAPYAATMRTVLGQMGVPQNMIWTEEQSRSTYESARDSAEILKSKGITKIALVTEAYHMTRSELTFRKQGLDVVPAACCFHVDPDDFPGFGPSSEAIEWNQTTLHEVFGLAWYWMRGRI